MKSICSPPAVFTFAVLPAAGDGFPKLIAHRGASEDAPENTLAAGRRRSPDGCLNLLLTHTGPLNRVFAIAPGVAAP